MTRIRMTRAAVIILLMLILPTPDAARATQILPVNLEQIVSGASRIFTGTCVAVEDGVVPGTSIPVTAYTFSVSDPIKGDLEKTVVVRHLGVRRPRPQGDRMLVFRVPGMPVYREGQEVVLFLNPASSLGLSSPIGLSQGAFQIVRVDGKKMVQNGLGNKGLFLGIDAREFGTKWKLTPDQQTVVGSEGPMDYDLFLEVIRKMIVLP